MNDKKLLIAGFAALCALPAQAQLFKCQGPDGKIVYSDQRCESKAEVKGVPPGVKNDAHGIEQRAKEEKEEKARKAMEAEIAADAAARAAARAAAASRAAGNASPGSQSASPGAEMKFEAPAAAPSSSAPTGLSSSQEQRIRNLEATRAQSGNTQQQRSAAQMEIDSIRRGTEDKLSSADRDRRDALIKDMGSLDAQRRNNAMRDLQDLYRKAER